MVLKALAAQEVRAAIEESFPGVGVTADGMAVLVPSELVAKVLRLLKERPEWGFNYLTSVTAVDYLQFFEVVYHLMSLENRHTLVVKTRCQGRENPEVPSVTQLWQGADFQEREIYDLMGISFPGHPNQKRIFLWEGFEGHPLRKDYL